MLQMSQASKKIMVNSIASLSYLMHAIKTLLCSLDAFMQNVCELQSQANELMFELPNIKLE